MRRHPDCREPEDTHGCPHPLDERVDCLLCEGLAYHTLCDLCGVTFPDPDANRQQDADHAEYLRCAISAALS